MVWCKQSCRRRIGTFANGQLRFLKNLGESYFCSSTKSRLEIPGYQLQLAIHWSMDILKNRGCLETGFFQSKDQEIGGHPHVE
jgi:hypothetical protein